MGNEAQAAEGAQAITESLRRSRMALAQQLDQTAGNLEVTEASAESCSSSQGRHRLMGFLGGGNVLWGLVDSQCHNPCLNISRDLSAY
eukprot:1139763-Pelagomonas_calceolata.AAC.2